MNQNVNIPANGTSVQFILGSYNYIYFRTASNPFQFSFNGTDWLNGNLNDNLPAPAASSRIFFRSVTGLAIAVSFDYSTLPIESQSTFQRISETYLKCGIIDVGGITSATAILIPGKDNGHLRKQIVFTVEGDGSVIATNKRAGADVGGMRVTKTTPQTVETAADFYVYNGGSGPTLWLTETYYTD